MADDDQQKTQAEFETTFRDSISAGLRSVAREIDVVNRKIREVNDIKPFNQMSDGASQLGNSMTQTSRALGVMNNFLGGFVKGVLGPAGAVGAVVAFAKSLETFSVNQIRVENFSRATGFAVKDIDQFTQSMKLSGHSVEESQGYLQRLGGLFNEFRMYRGLGGEMFTGIMELRGGLETLGPMFRKVLVGDYRAALDELARVFVAAGDGSSTLTRAQLALVEKFKIPADVYENWIKNKNNLIDIYRDMSGDAQQYVLGWQQTKWKIQYAWDDVSAHARRMILDIGNDLGLGESDYHHWADSINAALAGPVKESIQTTIKELKSLWGFLEKVGNWIPFKIVDGAVAFDSEKAKKSQVARNAFKYLGGPNAPGTHPDDVAAADRSQDKQVPPEVAKNFWYWWNQKRSDLGTRGADADKMEFSGARRRPAPSMLDVMKNRIKENAPYWTGAIPGSALLRLMKYDNEANSNNMRSRLRRILGIPDDPNDPVPWKQGLVDDSTKELTDIEFDSNRLLGEVRDILKRMEEGGGNTGAGNDPSGATAGRGDRSGPAGGPAAPAEAAGITAKQAGIQPIFPVAKGVNVAGLDAEWVARANEVYKQMTPEERKGFRVISGLRSDQQQAEIYRRSGGGRRFMAAPPGRSEHNPSRGGVAGDVVDPSGGFHRRGPGLGLTQLPGDRPHMRIGPLGRRLVPRGGPRAKGKDKVSDLSLDRNLIDSALAGGGSDDDTLEGTVKVTFGDLPNTDNTVPFIPLGISSPPQAAVAGLGATADYSNFWYYA